MGQMVSKPGVLSEVGRPSRVSSLPRATGVVKVTAASPLASVLRSRHLLGDTAFVEEQ